MKPIQLLVAVSLIAIAFSPAIAKESRAKKQAKLDTACEVTRQKLLAPLKKKFVEECVATRELPSRRACETFYADYGNRMGGRAPLFYDLPECVAAFDYQQSVRSSR